MNVAYGTGAYGLQVYGSEPSIWSGIGLNYGQQVTSAFYDTAQVETDLTFLKSVGVNRLRIAVPAFGGGTITTRCQDMVTRALQHGFYVVWGVSTGKTVGTLDATTWTNCKNYITGTIAPWAQSHGLSELIVCNEADYEADGTTLTSATVRSDIRALASSVKAGGFTGLVSQTTNIAMRASWISEGIGTLDLIGWNSYDTLANFMTHNGIVQAAFGNKTYISEFGSQGGGFSDFNDETLFYNDTLSRINSMQNVGIQSGYFFTYRDGGFGLTPDTFALVLSTGAPRQARNAVLGLTFQMPFIPRVFGGTLNLNVQQTIPQYITVTWVTRDLQIIWSARDKQVPWKARS